MPRLPATQLGSVQDETLEMVDLINAQPLVAEFYRWLTEGSAFQKILKHIEYIQTENNTFRPS